MLIVISLIVLFVMGYLTTHELSNTLLVIECVGGVILVILASEGVSPNILVPIFWGSVAVISGHVTRLIYP